jgi:hypothetical protein
MRNAAADLASILMLHWRSLLLSASSRPSAWLR